MPNLAPKSLLEKVEHHKKDAKPWTPWPYQERALKALLENAQYGLLLAPGMGKTSTTLAAIKILLKKGLIKRALITAPLRAVYSVWPLELADWTDFHDMDFALLHGPDKDRTLRQLTNQQICLINPEAFQWLTAEAWRMKALGADMFVCDESSLWKSSQTQRFRALRPRIPGFKRRVILTGSPRPNNYLDLHSQIYILDRGAALGAYLTHYRNNWFYPTGWQGREWALVPGKDKEINALVAPMVLRLDAEAYLKLPKVPPDIVHAVELPAKVAKEYDAIEESMMSVLFDAPLTSSAAARSKCAQIANGSVYVDARPDEESFRRERPFQVLHTAKVDALADLYRELQGSPLLVGIGFHHDVSEIRKALGFDVPCINGATTKSQAADYIERWNKGQLDVLLGHPASMGHGLNLQGCGCQHVAFFDIPDSYDLFDQFFQRVRRQGNKAACVMRHLFIAAGTVDEAKRRNLARKGSGQKAFLDAMRDYAVAKYGRVPGKRR